MPKTLRKGATGPDVILLQSTLKHAATDTLQYLLDVDGIFGPLTLAEGKGISTQ